jgi:hypothetical protein
MLSEVGKRTDAFDEANSVRIVLADGQGWAFVKPHFQFRPRFQDSKVVRVERAITYGGDCDRLVEAIGDGSIDQFSGVASLAAFVLRKSYTLAEEELDQLLAFSPDDAASMEWPRRVMEVVVGVFGTVTHTASE